MKNIILLLMAAFVAIPTYSQEPATEVPPVAEEATAPEPSVAEEAPEPVVTEEAVLSEPVEPAEPAEPAEASMAEELSDEEAIDQAIEEARTDTPSVIRVEDTDKTRVTLGKNEVVIVEENGDTVVVGLGSRGISIVEGDDGVVINVLDMDEKRHEKKTKKRKSYFDPHWAGFEFGMNNFLTSDFSLVLPPESDFMDLNTGKSWNWNVNFVDFGVGLGTPYVGLVSGLGFEFLNFNFNGHNSIMKESGTNIIVEKPLPAEWSIDKSKLYTSYITAPLLLEFHIPTGGSRHIRIAGGVIGGIKMCSHTKVKYSEAGNKSKEKIKGDYNINPIRWGATFRVGYGEVNLFANYYFTPFFKNGMGPELYPFTVGLALVP